MSTIGQNGSRLKEYVGVGIIAFAALLAIAITVARSKAGDRENRPLLMEGPELLVPPRR